jgi:type II secretion system protein N
MSLRRFLPGKGCCGYLLYTLAFTLLMLWLQFPADSFKAKLESEFNRFSPARVWTIETLGFAPPAGLRLSGLELRSQHEDAVLFRAEELTLWPDVQQWRRDGTWVFKYLLRVPAGHISGTVQKEQDQLWVKTLVEDLSLEHSSLEQFVQVYERKITGMAEGNLTSSWQLSDGMLGEVQGELTIHDGTVTLQDTVLGMEKLVFERLAAQFIYREGTLQLKQGKMESRLLAAEYTGIVQPGNPFAFSLINIQGALQPRPEFLATLGNASLANLLTRQLQQGKLPFTITGTVQEPGLSFRGLPENLNQQLQSVGR